MPATVRTSVGSKQPLWSNQHGSVRVASTEGTLPLLTVYKETLSQRSKWSGGGGLVSVEKRSGRLLHASVCSPEPFSFPMGGGQGGSVIALNDRSRPANDYASGAQYTPAATARCDGVGCDEVC